MAEPQEPIDELDSDVVLEVEMLPAGQGDCLLVTVPGPRRDFLMLVDTGNGRHALEAIRARLRQLPEDPEDGRRHLDLFIVTHIDDDHLQHAVELLKDPDLRLTFGDIWFNGYRETQSARARAVVAGSESFNQADILTRTLHELGVRHNARFEHGPVQVPEVAGEPPTPTSTNRPTEASGSYLRVEMGPDAPEFTVLSPLPQDLRELGRSWRSTGHPRGGDRSPAIERSLVHGRSSPPPRPGAVVPSTRSQLRRLALSPFSPQETRENICSIVVLVEHRGRRLLLLGDGHPYVYEPALRTLRSDRQNTGPANPGDDRPFVIDIIKVAHHGSADNTTSALREYRASNYLISTNGERHDHPDSESLSRLIVDAEIPPTFHFNFLTDRVQRWAELAARVGGFAVKHQPVGGKVQLRSSARE